MLLPIKPICKANKIRKDGTSIIYIQYCLDSERRTLLNTGIAIPPKFWNGKKLFISELLPVSYGYAEQLNRQLLVLRRKVEDIVTLAATKKIENPIRFLNDFFSRDIDAVRAVRIEEVLNEEKKKKTMENPRLNLDVYFQIDEYINSKAHKVTPGMLRIYRNMKDIYWHFRNIGISQSLSNHLTWIFMNRLLITLPAITYSRDERKSFMG